MLKEEQPDQGLLPRPIPWIGTASANSVESPRMYIEDLLWYCDADITWLEAGISETITTQKQVLFQQNKRL